MRPPVPFNIYYHIHSLMHISSVSKLGGSCIVARTSVTAFSLFFTFPLLKWYKSLAFFAQRSNYAKVEEYIPSESPRGVETHEG